VMWIVTLESAKDRVLGVDTLGQQVLSRVRYGTTCLLIWDAVRSVSCSVEWEIGVVTHPGSHSA
jgi:ABC-type dipeptide/oligopeptide/nickel transport system permease subunit